MVVTPMHPIGPTMSEVDPCFGTDGIRGKVDKVISPALYLQAGYWFGQILKENGPILIGMDSRLSGPMLRSAITAGLTASGHEVWDLGICPTPAVSELIRRVNAGGGLMISASHNPPEDNGIKFFNSDGSKITKDQQEAIISGIRGVPSIDKSYQSSNNFGIAYERNELLNVYIDSLLQTIRRERLEGLTIVLDLCWGAATSCGHEIFKELGSNLIIINGTPNGNRINQKCGSTNLDPLKQAVLDNGADMGFAFDGDADRVLAIDSKGRVIDGDHILFLWGSDLQAQGELPNQMLVATVMSNLGFEKAWLAKGGLFERTAVGDHNVYSKMLTNGAALGGEQSGHILTSLNGLRGDGLLTALQLSTICKRKGITLTEWLDESFSPYPQKLVNLTITKAGPNSNWKECKPLQKAILNAQAAMGKDGRVLVRASGTEPLLRVLVEAEDPKAVESWSNELKNLAIQHINAA